MLAWELPICGDFTLQRPVLFVVQVAAPDAPPLQAALTLALASRRSLESCTTIVTVADHWLLTHAELASRSPMCKLVGTGVAVAVEVAVDVGVSVGVSVGV